MRKHIIYGVTFPMALILSGLCYANPLTDAVNALKRAFPKYDWQPQTAILIDINGDGFKDVAMLGTSEIFAAVGVSFGHSNGHTKTKCFNISRGCGSKCVMCSDNAALRIEKQSDALLAELGKFPQGYRIGNSCFEIVLDDGVCDPIHIYWNHKAKELDWWRGRY
jgi:hypothetical protein